MKRESGIFASGTAGRPAALKRLLCLALGLLVAACCTATPPYGEKYRPQYHFSPARGWIGDPDGLVRRNGTYHLYWWGHATSEDLVHWREHPYPMKGGDRKFAYFSGSVVVDRHNTGGFGDEAMVAFYTMHFPGDTIPEKQAISVSRDGGMSYDFYDGNPVLDIGRIFFRDPQVFWYAPDRQWKMVVSRPDEQIVCIYESDDLRTWRCCSLFGGLGAGGAFWECPDLFEIGVEGSDERKWVLLIGRGPNRVQYFVGDFDGNTFTPDREIADWLQRPAEPVEGLPDHALWLDYGDDYYATRTWRNYDDEPDTPDGSVLAIGWMGNWDYARKAPTSWGKGFHSLPRTMILRRTEEGYRLVQRPVDQLRQLRGRHYRARRIDVEGVAAPGSFAPKENVYELEIEFAPVSAARFGLELLKGEGRSLRLVYDTQSGLLSLDRTACTDFTDDAEFTAAFARQMKARVPLREGRLRLHLFVDRSSVEVFADDGLTVMSAVTYPSDAQVGVELLSEGGLTTVTGFDAWELASIWK